MSMEINLQRVDRVYYPGEKVHGYVVVDSPKGTLQHSGITMEVEGSIGLQLSAKAVGLFDAFYANVKPIRIMHFNIDVQKGTKLAQGKTELPFEFRIAPLDDMRLFETYHGVYINITYNLNCEMARSLLAKNMKAQLEFVVHMPSKEEPVEKRVPFKVTPESLENVKRTSLTAIPRFRLSGHLDSSVCNIMKPFTGEIVVEECEAVIKSIELQLIRVETCGGLEGVAREATEIQSIQVADGDVQRNLRIPLYMIFPRLFTCPTTAANTFKIEFEVNIVVQMQDGYTVTENFPIKLIRC
mmetsp:Transcript_38065/g.98272  ORF Transcript_38065/g.98272 Transcript_38065/m.98272 type:complete len:298 (-) Transcript_38065:456-1349(-)